MDYRRDDPYQGSAAVFEDLTDYSKTARGRAKGLVLKDNRGIITSMIRALIMGSLAIGVRYAIIELLGLFDKTPVITSLVFATATSLVGVLLSTTFWFNVNRYREGHGSFSRTIQSARTFGQTFLFLIKNKKNDYKKQVFLLQEIVRAMIQTAVFRASGGLPAVDDLKISNVIKTFLKSQMGSDERTVVSKDIMVSSIHKIGVDLVRACDNSQMINQPKLLLEQLALYQDRCNDLAGLAPTTNAKFATLITRVVMFLYLVAVVYDFFAGYSVASAIVFVYAVALAYESLLVGSEMMSKFWQSRLDNAYVEAGGADIKTIAERSAFVFDRLVEEWNTEKEDIIATMMTMPIEVLSGGDIKPMMSYDPIGFYHNH
jgi:hypothetical protein